jgi:rifampicin phosphotransferase
MDHSSQAPRHSVTSAKSRPFIQIVKGGKRMSSYVLGFQDIGKTKIMVVGGKGANLGEIPRLKEFAFQMTFVFPPKPLRESLGKRRRLTNYLISYRF